MKMRRSGLFLCCVLFAAVLPAFSAGWDARLAANYLDSRQKEWFAWKVAAAPGGPCVSCHTGATYLAARSALRGALRETAPTEYETGLLNGLRARVAKTEAKDEHAAQGLGVEAIFSALFLSAEDNSRGGLSTETRQAFDRLWALQAGEGQNKGAWEWFSLKLDPWEMPHSRFYGAALAALAVANTPAEYRAKPEVAVKIAALGDYLRREQAAQPLHNRLVLLWSAAGIPEVLPKQARMDLIEEVWRLQRDDGGWSTESLGPWAKHDAAPPAEGSNCYATALAAFVLQKAGVRRTDPRLQRALTWLRSHQDRETGAWPASSMNKVYPPGSMQVRFMQDAATAYAALALIEAER